MEIFRGKDVDCVSQRTGAELSRNLPISGQVWSWTGFSEDWVEMYLFELPVIFFGWDKDGIFSFFHSFLALPSPLSLLIFLVSRGHNVHLSCFHSCWGFGWFHSVVNCFLLFPLGSAGTTSKNKGLLCRPIFFLVFLREPASEEASWSYHLLTFSAHPFFFTFWRKKYCRGSFQILTRWLRDFLWEDWGRLRLFGGFRRLSPFSSYFSSPPLPYLKSCWALLQTILLIQ